MMTVHLREARWQDLAVMAVLESRCFPHDAWSEATFWAELAQRPRRRYWVAEARRADPDPASETPEAPAGALLGYAGLDLSGELADVMTLAVDPRQRGSGIGSRLLEQLHSVARAEGANAVMLEVRADSTAARRLYQGQGYLTLHTRPDYYRTHEGPSVDALVLRKELL